MRGLNTMPVAVFFLGSALIACTDPGKTVGSSGGGPNGITGSAKDTFWSKGGDVLAYDQGRWIAVDAIADKSYPGTISDVGNIDIPNVPMGQYWLALTASPPKNLPDAQPARTFVETDARVLDIGRVNTGRSNIAPMTQPTYFVINATFGIPFQEFTQDAMGQIIQPLSDEILFVSRGAGMWGYPGESPLGTAPTNGATEVQGWKFDLKNFFDLINGGSPLVDTTKGDDFVVIHDVAKLVGNSMPDGDPWTGYRYKSTQEAFESSSVTMTNGGTTNLTLDFMPIVQKNFDLDYKGSAFNDLIPPGITTPITLSMSVDMNAGAPRPGVGTFAELWSVNTDSETAYTNPDSACHGMGCDPATCPSGCDLGTLVHPGDHAHSYMYGNPFSYGHERFEMTIIFGPSLGKLLPEMTGERLQGRFTISAPVADYNGKPVTPVVSLPQNINVGGNALLYDQINKGVGTTPTVSWSAPALGTPTLYQLRVIDLTDLTGTDGVKTQRRTVATTYTKGNQVTIPDGIMKSGTNYYFQVIAEIWDEYDSSKPFMIPERLATAGMYTGIMTP